MGAIIAGSGFVSRMPRRCCAPAGSAGHAGAARVGRPRTCTLPAAEQTRRTGEIDIIFLVGYFVVINLILDVLYMYLDPRIHYA